VVGQCDCRVISCGPPCCKCKRGRLCAEDADGMSKPSFCRASIYRGLSSEKRKNVPRKVVVEVASVINEFKSSL
jgi:hypothetical protein